MLAFEDEGMACSRVLVEIHSGVYHGFGPKGADRDIAATCKENREPAVTNILTPVNTLIRIRL